MRRRTRGFSLLELAVVISVAMAVAWVLLSFLNRYQGVAERDMVDMNVHNMRTGMRLQVAQMLLAGRQRELPTLVGANPAQWLSGALSNYLGELAAPPPATIRGCWYFYTPTKQLIYRSKSENFPGGAGLELRWQVVRSGGQDSGVTLVESGVRP